MKENILAIIPARGGSKAVPRKNIKIMGGQPLIKYIFDSVSSSQFIQKIILSTDDQEIAEVGKSIGFEVPFIRPLELATDNASLISVIRHALSFFDSAGFFVDAVLSLQPTCPFLMTATIDSAIELWLETGCDSVTTIAEITKGHPYISKRMKTGNIIEPFIPVPKEVDNSQRQSREKAYYLTGGFYLRSRSLIESEDTDSHILGQDSRAVVVNEIEASDINTAFDFKLAEFMTRERNINP